MLAPPEGKAGLLAFVSAEDRAAALAEMSTAEQLRVLVKMSTHQRNITAEDLDAAAREEIYELGTLEQRARLMTAMSAYSRAECAGRLSAEERVAVFAMALDNSDLQVGSLPVLPACCAVFALRSSS